MLGNQVMYQKFFSAKSEKAARTSVVGWILGTLLLETLIVAIAVIGSAMYQTGEVLRQPYEIIPYTARRGLPAFMGAVLLGAVFAKVILLLPTTVFTGFELDRGRFCAYMRPRLRISRYSSSRGWLWCCWVLGALPGCLCAQHPGQDALGVYHLFRGDYAGGVGGFLLQRVTAWGAVGAIGLERWSRFLGI